MSGQNYGELFCEAVDTIVKQRLQGMAFDQTILCTIIDDSKREQGIYKVSNGSSQFEAYSSITDYRNDNNVYVQLPKGDWSAQKFIIGKKNKNDVEEAFVYKNPFSSLVDITGNLVKVDTSSYNKNALIANHPDELDDDGNIIKNYQEVALWTYTGTKLSSYTRLGIQAQFQSWLNPYTVPVEKSDEFGTIEYSVRTENVTTGNYGLKLRVWALQDNITEENQKENNQTLTPYEFQLNTSDMNGNPYNFQTFFQQEKLYDISDLREIQGMELVFFQEAGSFQNDKGEKRPYQNDFFGTKQDIDPNLFVKDVYISLGYGVEEFDEEMVNIYTLQSSNYVRTAEPFENNHRRIELRWIHKQKDGSFKSITAQNNDLNFEIRWYRYSLGAPSADEYSDVYWTALSKQITNGVLSEYTILDEDWEEYNNSLLDSEVKDKTRRPGFFYTWVLPDVALQTEQIKAVIIYNGKPYRSNVLVLRNEDEVVSRPTVDAIQALTINCEDGTYGNYRIYAEGNQLVNPSDSSVRREFKLYFKSEYEDTQPNAETGSYELIEARNLEWVIPSRNSMIRLPSEWEQYFQDENKLPQENAPQILEGVDNNGNTDIFLWIDDQNNYHIKRFGWKDSNDNSAVYQIYNQQPYYINSYYSEQYSNNTISCTIEKEPNTFYTATKTLTFGIAGTTGTDVTLVIDFKDVSIHAIDIEDSTDNAQIFIANLYDSENKNVTEDAISKGCKFQWGWLIDSSEGNIQPNNDGRNLSFRISDSLNINECEVYFSNKLTEIDIVSWNILACTVTGWGNYPLVAFLPIPIKRKIVDVCEPTYIQGAQRIIYSSEGYPSYYKGPYELYCSENYGSSKQEGITWQMSYKDNDLGDIKYYPQLIIETENEGPYVKNSLQALNFYVKDSSDNINVLCKYEDIVIWSQPLLIMQNRYPSAMLNKWDGSLTIDENENAILAAKVAAGRKNDDNTFSGVLMGDVKNDLGSEDIFIDGSGVTHSVNSTTGLYGFNHGALSFGFRDNGTAFIGKSDHGRILFNGNKGLIHSASWDSEKNKDLADGMYIDLDDAILIMQKDFSEDTTIASGTYVRKYPTQEEFNNNKTQYYYHRAYNIIQHNGNLDDTIKYYSPFAYEEVKVYVDEYQTLMADGKPKFYSYYYALDIPDTTVEEGKDPTTGDIESDGSVNTGGFDDENSDVIIQNIIPKYTLLTISQIPEELLDEDGNNYAPAEQVDSEGNKYYSLYIPSDFSENNNLLEGNWYYYQNEISKNDDGIEVLPQVADAAIFDPTLNYYIVESYKENIGTSTDNTQVYNRRYITLSADEKVYPLAIGATHLISSRKFRVKWDGTVYIQDGQFSGTINATDGTLGNLRVLGTLSGGIISGAQISGSKITGSRVEANYLYCQNGNIGGWTIGYNYLRGGGITLNSSSGQIIGGTIKGSTIYSNTGQIGGWYITSSTFQNKDNKTDSTSKATIKLNSQDGSIQGGILRTRYDAADSEYKYGMILDGYLTIADPADGTKVNGSYFGFLPSNTGNSLIDNVSQGFGMLMNTTDYAYRSVVTNNSVGFSVINKDENRTNNISMQQSQIDFTAAATDASNFASVATGYYKMGSGGDFSYSYCPVGSWSQAEGGGYLPNTEDIRIKITQDKIEIGQDFKSAEAIEHTGAFDTTWYTYGAIDIGNESLGALQLTSALSCSMSAAGGSVECSDGGASLEAGNGSIGVRAGVNASMSFNGSSITLGLDDALTIQNSAGGDITFGSGLLTLLAPGGGRIETSSELYVKGNLTLNSNFNQTAGAFTSNAQANFTTSIATPSMRVTETLNASGATCIGVYAVLG